MGYLKHPIAIALLVWSAGVGLAGDGVIEINQAKALAGEVTPSDTPGFPVTIDTEGSYLLTGNLDLHLLSKDIDAIKVIANNVVIDLNGFEIEGPCAVPCVPVGIGGGIDANVTHTTVRNGTIRNMGREGVSVGNFGVVTDVRTIDNSHYGIITGGFATVRNSVAAGNANVGIRPTTSSRVIDCTAEGNTLDGILPNGPGIALIGNVVDGNSGDGIDAVFCSACLIENNTARSNTGNGIVSAAGSVLRDNTSSDNTGWGISAMGLASVLIGNSAYSNDGGGINAAADVGLSRNVSRFNTSTDLAGGLLLDCNVIGGVLSCPP